MCLFVSNLCCYVAGVFFQLVQCHKDRGNCSSFLRITAPLLGGDANIFPQQFLQRSAQDTQGTQFHHLVGGLVAINFIFPLILGIILESSSQLTNSYFSEGWRKTTNQTMVLRMDPDFLRFILCCDKCVHACSCCFEFHGESTGNHIVFLWCFFPMEYGGFR